MADYKCTRSIALPGPKDQPGRISSEVVALHFDSVAVSVVPDCSSCA